MTHIKTPLPIRKRASREAGKSSAKAQGDNSSRASYRGILARDADLTALEAAKQMFEDGASSENVRQATGWFKGYDGKWRFEIDDSKMKVVKSDKEYLKKAKSTLLGYLIKHDELFKSYPDLKDVYVKLEDIGGEGSAYYNVSTGELVINESEFDSLSDKALKKLLIHEIQHAIQNIESFTGGADTKDFAAYLNTAGEIEAYDVGDRVGMTAEQRKNTRPDIDRTDVVFAGDGTSYAMFLTR